MNKFALVLICELILSSCAFAEVTSNQKRIFKHYAIAALFELCEHSINHKCTALDYRLDILELEPEIYFYKNQVMVLFSIADNQFPYVMLKYNKDRYLYIINRGTWLADKQEFIDGFIESGNFISEDMPSKSAGDRR